ncbi:hypothetical protein MRX96_049109 [Rhipicephalus microplus]
MYDFLPYLFNQVETLDSQNILKTSAPRITPASEDYLPVTSTASTRLSRPGHIAPNDGGSGKPECTGIICRVLASRLRKKLDYSVDPCKDFYKFVCNTFRGVDEFTHTKYLVEWMTSLNLDLADERRLQTVNPVEMMVHGSLDLGVRAVIAITFDEMQLVANKKPIQVAIVQLSEHWMRVFERL